MNILNNSIDLYLITQLKFVFFNLLLMVVFLIQKIKKHGLKSTIIHEELMKRTFKLGDFFNLILDRSLIKIPSDNSDAVEANSINKNDSIATH